MILEIESVQRNFTKRLPGLKDVAYSERLNNSQLQSLEHRRLINDLVFCYTIVHGLTAINFSNFFSFTSNPSSRGHSLRITTSIPKSNLDKHFFLHTGSSNLGTLSHNQKYHHQIRQLSNLGFSNSTFPNSSSYPPFRDLFYNLLLT